METLLRKVQAMLIPLWLLVASGVMNLSTASSLNAGESPPTADDVRELMKKQPLTEATWPIWRDYFVRLYYAYEVGEPEEFYTRIGEFIGEIASKNDGVLPGEWGADPVAWIVLSHYIRHSGFAFPERIEEANRRALALGDPSGMSSCDLACSLIALVGHRNEPDQLGPESRKQLDEAERLLQAVVRTTPQARLSYWHGLIAWIRGEKASAIPLLRQGALEHPGQNDCAVQFLTMWLSCKQATKPFAEMSDPFVKLFPDDPRIRGIHAAALFRDERFREAYEMLQQARRRGAEVVDFLGSKSVEAIEEGRWLTSPVVEGMNLAKNSKHREAVPQFRRAIGEDSKNILAARFLARSLVACASAPEMAVNSAELGQILEEGAELCQRFPNDAELQVAQAAVLFRAGRVVEADNAMNRAQELGGDLAALAGARGVSMIRQAARRESIERHVRLGLIGGAAVFATWLAIMFLLGVLLAVSTSRVPVYHEHHQTVGSGEIWRERFYLIVLSLSVLIFYVSVPFVALGLLAITLVLFGILLALRVIHLGILSRGFFATWGVIRSAFVGSSEEVLGIIATQRQHPQLFAALQEVADRLATSPVDTVYLTPSSLTGVREEGKGPFGVFRRRRVMELGVSTMSVLTTSEFKSILAHEYAHFTNRDSVYIRFISQATASLGNSLAVMNAAGGFINYVNPFFWAYWLYLRAYILLAAGFSRSREFLADRRAVLEYGTEPFASALTRTAVDGTLFEWSAVPNVMNELNAGRAFVNVFDTFRQFREQAEHAGAQGKVLDDIRAAKSNWCDSHPTLSERLAALPRVAESNESLDSIPATSLISEITSIEEQLTKLLTDHIQNALAGAGGNN